MNVIRKHWLSTALAVALQGICTLANPRILNRGGSAPEVQAEHWYSIRAAGEGADKAIEIYVYGEIGYWGITSADFIRDLQALDDGTSPVVVAIDSIGGDLFDGIAIHNTLNRLGERCTARIDGACYSAASIIAAGAHRVEMADNALLMIHNPWTFAAGDSADLRKVADMMDKAFDGIVASYQHRPLTIEDTDLRRLINEETWFTAGEAKDAGFVDEVLTGDYPKFSNSHGKILNRYQHPPQAAHDLLASNEPDPEPESDPEPEPEPDTATLAKELADACQAAGLANLTSVLILSSGLKSRAAVQAEVVRAKAVRDLCVLAKLPGEAEQLITDGLNADAARVKLFDKVVASTSQVEIDNKPPLSETQPAPTAKAVDPGDIYASRKPKSS
ncbi:head maturation protease, ClpP-related [Pseudomonas sp. S9]|uniref:head maturation protease, ClpP-related n=1 Tax=Pseudomonas sp. S9 TaxID=686578 RepID=UPI0002556FF2|nr:head maturation protease, ClpP-related [Pseudomonas sp. S9]